MIKITRPPEPDVLTQNCATWTAELLGHITNGTSVPDALATRYRHPDIKAALMTAAHEKCVYCESKQRHVAHGDIEHLKPKSRYRNETFTWDNLAFVCRVCNQLKSDTYDPACPPLNPFVDDPTTHLVTAGTLIYGKAGDNRGQLTAALVHLNRAELLERRKEKIDALYQLVDRASRAPAAIQGILKAEMERLVADDQEYSMILKAALTQFRGELNIA